MVDQDTQPVERKHESSGVQGLGDKTPEELAIELVRRVFPADEVKVGGKRWEVHKVWARMTHAIGFHDYQVSMVYDLDTGVLEPPRMRCWICNHEP